MKTVRLSFVIEVPSTLSTDDIELATEDILANALNIYHIASSHKLKYCFNVKAEEVKRGKVGHYIPVKKKSN